MALSLGKGTIRRHCWSGTVYWKEGWGVNAYMYPRCILKVVRTRWCKKEN